MPTLYKRGPLDSSRVLFLPVDSIQPNPYQPRQSFAQEDLDGLAQSIQALGLLQPLTVRRGTAGWELVAGERRLRAARLAGLDKVPCLPIQVDSQMTSLLALTENIQRKDLDFWEEALALRRLLDTFHLSQEEAARRVGKSPSAVANTLRLELVGEPVRVIEIAPGMVATEEFSLNRLHGDAEAAAKVYAGVAEPLSADDVAACIVWTLELPAHVNIDSMVVRPRAQASNTLVAREQ